MAFVDKQGREFKNASEWIKAVSEDAQAKANAATARSHAARSREAEQVARSKRASDNRVAQGTEVPQGKVGATS